MTSDALAAAVEAEVERRASLRAEQIVAARIARGELVEVVDPRDDERAAAYGLRRRRAA